MFRFGPYIEAHIISYIVFVPPNLKQIHEERQSRLNNNHLFFHNRTDILDEFVIQLIIDKDIIYGDLELIGFRRELNIIHMYFRMSNKQYLIDFLTYIVKKNGVPNEVYQHKSREALYRLYLNL